MPARYFDAIEAGAAPLPPPHRLGRSREGRPIPACRYGRGPVRVSLLAGCHADEPCGPALLRRLAGFLSALPADHPLLIDYSWWIVPHANPDGEAVNRGWHDEDDPGPYDLARYLRGAERAHPRDDVEYGFPVAGREGPKGPENEFIYDFWRSAGAPFHLHVSLHSMPIGYGAWFLIEPDWAARTGPLRDHCRQVAAGLGYGLHDLDRHGEKGFVRVAPGFATRPGSRPMRQYFLEQEVRVTPRYFHPSSMESIRSLGGDCLTLVPEVPFWILPPDDAGQATGFEAWKKQLETWRAGLLLGKRTDGEVNAEAARRGLRAVPVRDQMRMQWALLEAGMEAVNNLG